MTKLLKNIKPFSVLLQCNEGIQVNLNPGEVIAYNLVTVEDNKNPLYNAHIINDYIKQDILTILTLPDPIKPIILPPTFFSLRRFGSFDISLNASGDLPITWSWNWDNLINGTDLILNSTTGHITSVFGLNYASTFNVTATNSGGSDTKPITITVFLPF